MAKNLLTLTELTDTPELEKYTCHSAQTGVSLVNCLRPYYKPTTARKANKVTVAPVPREAIKKEAVFILEWASFRKPYSAAVTSVHKRSPGCGAVRSLTDEIATANHVFS